MKKKIIDLPSFSREEKRKQSKLIEATYNAIFKLNNDDLLMHYYEVVKELEKRGVSVCSKL